MNNLSFNISKTKALALLLVKFLGLVLIMTSCKKDDTKKLKESYISFDINGIAHEFRSKTDLTFEFVGFIQTTGKEKPTKHVHLNTPIFIQIKDFEKPISIGTYSGKTYSSNGWTREVFMSYKAEKDSLAFQSNFASPMTEVIITSINREEITGTFSGILERQTLQGLDTIYITNGAFALYNYKTY